MFLLRQFLAGFFCIITGRGDCHKHWGWISILPFEMVFIFRLKSFCLSKFVCHSLCLVANVALATCFMDAVFCLFPQNEFLIAPKSFELPAICVLCFVNSQ